MVDWGKSLKLSGFILASVFTAVYMANAAVVYEKVR
jgi:uncharacterized membrane protein (DUF485 family)